ncbi:hypothetical protein F511_40768 [Dorcoceras hygrometricum]|uniref:Uncharacterized protein n=1 Tax=Dorcoceras hygrometricum TaxID=472368 RepID=A0A2Z7CCA0_9LAMI|nr:hypothetical protein F511_40768 [Dorcoceras hygrometricum]
MAVIDVMKSADVILCVVPEKSNAIIGVVTTGFECLPPSCDGMTGSEDHGPMISPVDTPCGSDKSKSGSVGLLLLRRFVWILFSNICLKLVRCAKTSPLCFPGFSAGRGFDPAGVIPGGG